MLDTVVFGALFPPCTLTLTSHCAESTKRIPQPRLTIGRKKRRTHRAPTLLWPSDLPVRLFNNTQPHFLLPAAGVAFVPALAWPSRLVQPQRLNFNHSVLITKP